MEQMTLFPVKKETKFKPKTEEEYQKQYNLEQLENKDKKVTIKVKYGLDFQNKKDFFVSDDRVKSCLGGCDSSACSVDEVGLEKAEEEAVEWIKKDILEDGYKEENITIVKEEMTKEEEVEHYEMIVDRMKKDIEFEKNREIKIKEQLNDIKLNIEECNKKIQESEVVLNEIRR
jgi:hypothetical protein